MRELAIYHITALVAGYLIDLIVGDPHSLPHPVRLMGRLIGFLTDKSIGTKGEVRKEISEKSKRIRGTMMCLTVILLSAITAMLILLPAYKISIYTGIAAEAILTAYFLAARSLFDESMKVYYSIGENDIIAARKNVSMIVGRDTDNLSEEGVIKAAVETVAENASDGVIAPLFFAAIGGPVLCAVYKSINTMDSMVGYKNERFIDFGRFAARLDDYVNYIPSRLGALLIIAAALLCSAFSDGYSAKNALRIFMRDRKKSSSPNSAQTESACAGALGVELLGDASYFGKTVHKDTIGDRIRRIENEDIKRANILMFVSEFLFLIFYLFVVVGIVIIIC